MSRLSHVLLFDSDTKGRETLVYGLEGDAVSVRVPGSLEEGRQMVTSAPRPEVIIAVLRQGDDAATALVRHLAGSADLRDVPRLLLSPTDQPPEPLRGLAGAQSFIPLPAYVRDVITAAKLLGAAGSSDASASNDGSASESRVTGPLADFGLLFLVRTMVSLTRSGVVQVARGTRQGEVRFSEGEIVGAEVGAREGQAALHQLLLWEEGTLTITFKPVARRAAGFPRGEELLDDLERFLRDFDHATKSIGQAQSLFVQDSEKVAASLDAIAPEIIPVMKLFDGQRNLGDVLEDSPFQPFDTLAATARLIEMGIIRRKAIEKPSSGLPSPRKPRAQERVQEWVSRGPDAAMVESTRPTLPAAPPPSAAADAIGNGSADARTASGHRRRSRRRTGEIPAVLDGPPAASSGAAGGPVAAGLSAPPPVAAPPSVRARTMPGRAPAGEMEDRGELEVHGELRALDKERAITPLPENMPTVMVDLGTTEPAEAAPSPPNSRLEAAPIAEAIPLPIIENNVVASDLPPAPAPTAARTATLPGPHSLGDTQPLGNAAASVPSSGVAPAEAAPREIASGVRSAEIDTGLRPAPPPELLEAPPSGPSIMLDPHLMAEMDAFELANSPRTPPPEVTEPPPAATAPAAAATTATPAPAAPAPASAPATPAPAAAPQPVPAAAAGGVVSFVRGPAQSNVPPGSSLNNAPTVPMSPVASHPPGAGAPTAASATAPPNSAGAIPEAQNKRRASSEFNALEADFFAREAELYKHANEPTESFDDLDPGGKLGGPRPATKPGPKRPT